MEHLQDQLQARAFMEHVEQVAVPSIDAWRARHASQVLDAFFPSVPANELDAARQAYTRRREELGALPALDDAWAEVRAAATGQGPDAVRAFRAAVDRMLSVTAPPAGTDVEPGAAPFPEEAPVPPGAQARG